MNADELFAAKRKFIQSGGKWLGAARTWIQWHCVNGDKVKWGSNTPLCPQITVKQVEEIAAEAAWAVMQQCIEDVEGKNRKSNPPEEPTIVNMIRNPLSL